MAQTREAKEQMVEELSTRLGEAQSVYITDFTGLNVEMVTQLRRELRAKHIECRVVKNTLARFAVQNAGLPDLGIYLEGPTALIFSNDPVTPAKILDTFKKSNNDRPGIKGGLLNGTVIEASQVADLAQLPSREELLAKAVSGIASPITGLVYSLSGIMSNFVRTLAAVSAKKASEESDAG